MENFSERGKQQLYKAFNDGLKIAAQKNVLVKRLLESTPEIQKAAADDFYVQFFFKNVAHNHITSDNSFIFPDIMNRIVFIDTKDFCQNTGQMLEYIGTQQEKNDFYTQKEAAMQKRIEPLQAQVDLLQQKRRLLQTHIDKTKWPFTKIKLKKQLQSVTKELADIDLKIANIKLNHIKNAPVRHNQQR